MREPPDTKNDQKARREARRAAALRENLKRRKAQARGRDRVQTDSAQPTAPGGKQNEGEDGNRA